jgi:hypothetical protein
VASCESLTKTVRRLYCRITPAGIKRDSVEAQIGPDRHHSESITLDVYSHAMPTKSDFEAIKRNVKDLQDGAKQLRDDMTQLQSHWNSQPWTQRHPDLKYVLSTILALVTLVVACLVGVEPMLEKYSGVLIKERVNDGLREQGAKTDQISRELLPVGLFT